MKSELVSLQGQLAKEREKNTALENYTRRENLKFMKIPEHEGETCKELVSNIIRNEISINTDNMRFHACSSPYGENSTRAKLTDNRKICCRENKDLVWSKKNKLHSSTKSEDAYITDYAKDIQEEGQVLIKAMIKARKQGIEMQGK